MLSNIMCNEIALNILVVYRCTAYRTSACPLCDGCSSESNYITIVSVFHLSANGFQHTYTAHSVAGAAAFLIRVSWLCVCVCNVYGTLSIFCLFSHLIILRFVVFLVRSFLIESHKHTLQMDAHRIVCYCTSERTKKIQYYTTNEYGQR